MIPASHQLELRGPHLLAVALVCVTFPLIWVGGLVTTYRAGMAVPDWPTTYGENLFLYDWHRWITGPWDLFIEHGHRLLGATVGLLTIAFVLAEWLWDRRRWMHWAAAGALLAVVGQGVLGGLRVRMDAVALARIHGCVGPAFFAYAVTLAVWTSRRWLAAEPAIVVKKGGQLQRLALATTALAYLQLVLGSALRHLPEGASPADFRLALVFHLIVAAGLAVHVGLLLGRVLSSAREPVAVVRSALVRPALGLGFLLVLQIGLGLTTWIVKYGWPTWLGDADLNYVVEAEGRLQAYATTAHVAVGSLILATAWLLSLRSLRLVKGGPAALDLRGQASAFDSTTQNAAGRMSSIPGNSVSEEAGSPDAVSSGSVAGIPRVSGLEVVA